MTDTQQLDQQRIDEENSADEVKSNEAAPITAIPANLEPQRPSRQVLGDQVTRTLEEEPKDQLLSEN